MIAIGNGEPCPFCGKILNKDIIEHLFEHHAEQMIKELFGDEDE